MLLSQIVLTFVCILTLYRCVIHFRRVFRHLFVTFAEHFVENFVSIWILIPIWLSLSVFAANLDPVALFPRRVVLGFCSL